MPAAKKSVYETLKAVKVGELVKSKGGFSYLPWADAVDQLLSQFPDATWDVHEWEGSPYVATSAGGFVQVTVTVGGIARTQVHPILDHRNKTIEADRINAFDVNTAIQRCLAKAISLHGLGIDIYRGEDINHLGGNGQGEKQSRNSGNEGDTRLITEKQQKRMFAISKQNEWGNDNVKELLGSYGYGSSDEVTRKDYEEICNTLEAGQELYLSTAEDLDNATRNDDYAGIESDTIPFPQDDAPNADDYRPGF